MTVIQIFLFSRRQVRCEYERGEPLTTHVADNSGKLYDKQVPPTDLYYRSYLPRGSLATTNTRASGEISDTDPNYPVPTYFQTRDDVTRHGRNHMYESPQALVHASPATGHLNTDRRNVCLSSAAVWILTKLDMFDKRDWNPAISKLLLWKQTTS